MSGILAHRTQDHMLYNPSVKPTNRYRAKMNLSEAKAKYPGSEVFRFGDSKELCDELTSLVISGKKVATCDALNGYESGNCYANDLKLSKYLDREFCFGICITSAQ